MYICMAPGTRVGIWQCVYRHCRFTVSWVLAGNKGKGRGTSGKGSNDGDKSQGGTCSGTALMGIGKGQQVER